MNFNGSHRAVEIVKSDTLVFSHPTEKVGLKKKVFVGPFSYFSFPSAHTPKLSLYENHALGFGDVRLGPGHARDFYFLPHLLFFCFSREEGKKGLAGAYNPRHNGWPNGCSFSSRKDTTVRPSTIVLMIVQ